MRLGYTLSSEEFDAPSLVAQAAAASLLPGRFSFGVGPDQEGFPDFYEREILPGFS